MSKKVLIIMMALVMVFSSFNTQTVYAGEAVKPDVPKFKVKVSEDESLFTFTISKTSNADGYRIYAKEPGSSKYRTVATIKKNGKKARTYKYSPFNPGQYTFKSRIVSPSKFYDIVTNHNATRHGLKLFGCYWVANEKAGETICVDQNGKILVGEFDCNVYEIGVVNVIKVDLKLCNIINK